MSLSVEQLRALDTVRRGGNVMITGPGGCGKSYLLDRIREEMAVSVCGSTGVAAVNVGGVTLHSFAGLGLADVSPQRLLERVRNNVPAWNRIKKMRKLALDEVSMVSADLFDKLDYVFRGVRGDDSPFGGVQMILLGDPLQLKPVNGEHVYRSSVWDEAGITVCSLTLPFRQTDGAFARALSCLRVGELDAEAKAVINSRSVSKVGEPPMDPPPVVITALNDEADRCNVSRLEQLAGAKVTYVAKDRGTESGRRLMKHFPVAERIALKPGARVMCMANLDVESGIVNGSMGTVRECQTDKALVEFDHGLERLIGVHSRKIELDGAVIAERQQLPLRLSWAVTAHKVQGCTLDRVEVRMGRAFEPSQTYVAMSRARRLDGLWIRSLNPAMLKPDSASLSFLRMLEARSHASTP